MKHLPKFGIILIGIVIVMSVAGCTSTGPALSMHKTSVTKVTYLGYQAYRVNASIYNEHAGTLKIDTNNFILSDSNSYTNTPVATAHSVIILENGEAASVSIVFIVTDGTTPSELTYYDGTNKVVCSI